MVYGKLALYTMYAAHSHSELWHIHGGSFDGHITFVGVKIHPLKIVLFLTIFLPVEPFVCPFTI
jgi:hypothetical protein